MKRGKKASLPWWWRRFYYSMLNQAGMRSSCGRLHGSGHAEQGSCHRWQISMLEIQLLHETVAALPPHQSSILTLVLELFNKPGLLFTPTASALNKSCLDYEKPITRCMKIHPNLMCISHTGLFCPVQYILIFVMVIMALWVKAVETWRIFSEAISIYSLTSRSKLDY